MKRLSSKALLLALVVTASVLTPRSALAASIVIKVGAIQGESVVAGHVGEIDVLAWSWGLAASTTTTRKGADVRSCSIQDFSFTKYIDTASGPLLVNAVLGTTVETAVLKLLPLPGGTNLTLTMTNVTVSSVSTGGSGAEERLTENVTLHFASLLGDYTTPGGQHVTFQVNPCG